MNPLARAVASCGIAALLLVAGAVPSAARIVKTRRPGQLRPGLEFTLGSGFEYQADGAEQEYGFPFLLEWGLTPTLDLTVEPALIAIHTDQGRSLRGWDDLETALSLEVISERRYRPTFALELGVKWPTATHSEIGTGLTDYSLGALVGKELVQGEIVFNAIISHVGVPSVGRVQDTAQLSAATEWHLGPTLDLTSELLTTQGIGSLRGSAGLAAPGGGGLNVPGAGSGELEATLGLAHYLGRRLKLEEGVIVQTDGTWQAVLAWEWNFGEGR